MTLDVYEILTNAILTSAQIGFRHFVLSAGNVFYTEIIEENFYEAHLADVLKNVKDGI